MVDKLRMFFTFLIGWEKISKWKLHEIWISGPINKVLLADSHAHLFNVVSIIAFELYSQSWMFWQDTYGIQNLKYLSCNFLGKKFATPDTRLRRPFLHVFQKSWNKNEYQLPNVKVRSSYTSDRLTNSVCSHPKSLYRTNRMKLLILEMLGKVPLSPGYNLVCWHPKTLQLANLN